MALLTIRVWPDEVLKRKTDLVEVVDDDVRRLLGDMAETMYKENGIGLAAPQVGVSRRLCVIDVPADEEAGEAASGLLYLVNPRITARQGSVVMNEGCLSFPELQVDVKRAAKVRVEYVDGDGAPRVLDAEELLAVCIQHELDHLDGIVFTDRLGPVSRRLALRDFEKLRKAAAG